MKNLTIIAVALSLSAPSLAQMAPAPAAPAAKPLTTCEALNADWRLVEQNMASRFADSVGDNSAPRATLREMEQANDLVKAQMTLAFMRDNKCSLPKRAPQVGTYLSAALACSSARLKASGSESPLACKRETWKAD